MKKDTNIQNDISQTIEKYNRESFSTRSQRSQSPLIQIKVFEEAINFLVETISDIDIEIEQKDNKIHFLENKRGIPDSKDIEEMNRLDLIKYQTKKK